MRSAQSGDCVLPPVGAQICEVNHRGMEGEYLAQCARVTRCGEEHTLTERQSWGPSNDKGLRMVNLESQSKTPPRVWKTDTFIVFNFFVLYSECHVSANLPLYCLFYVNMNIYFCFYLNIARDVVTVLLIFVNIYHFNYTLMHIHRHTHTSTHVWSAHKGNGNNQAQEPGWEGRGKRVSCRDKGPAHKKKCQRTHISNLQKNIPANRVTSKATTIFRIV